MTNKSYEKYAVLRRPLESGRQSPMNLSTVLIFGAVLQVGLYLLEYYVIGYSSIHPYKQEIVSWHFWFSIVLILLGLIFGVPFIYRRFEKIQYLISILYAQNLFGITLYICALFLATSQDYRLDVEEMLSFTWMTFIVGLLIFLLTLGRIIWKICKGDYAEGSHSDHIRAGFEYKSYLPIATVTGLGIFFVIQYVIQQIGLENLSIHLMIVMGIGLFYVMLFILPEQLIIFYCKLRFSSFNFHGRPYLDEPGDDGDEREAKASMGDLYYRK